jgi:hypothetical protein
MAPTKNSGSNPHHKRRDAPAGQSRGGAHAGPRHNGNGNGNGNGDRHATAAKRHHEDSRPGKHYTAPVASAAGGPGNVRAQQAVSKVASAKAASALEQRREALQQDGGAHLATKISRDLNRSVVTFKTKLLKLSYGTELDATFGLVPPTMTQHLGADISKLRSYIVRFQRGSPNHVLAFMKWYEWASFEAGKHGKYASNNHNNNGGDDEGEKVEEREPRTALGQVARDRKHIRALLTMCVRHNSTRRAEGVHALMNFLTNNCSGVAPCRTIEELKDAAPPSIAYAFSRLILGMATENFANVVLHCHALCEALKKCGAVTNQCLISIIDAELAMAARLRAAEQRMKQDRKKKADAAADDDTAGADVDPDELADPTVGERHQKTMACIFAIAALLCGHRDIKLAEASQLVKILSHCYVEHKGLRILTGNLILRLLRTVPAVLEDVHACEWLAHAHFKFEKLDYLRPEGIQLLIQFMVLTEAATLPDAARKAVPAPLRPYLSRDPLEPEVLESFSSALFRKEQVTACHPNVHPVWDQLMALIAQRATLGESLKTHIANFVNNVISPFRRGAVEVPRQDLFRKLVQSIGQLGLKAVDEEERELAIETVAAVGFGKRMAVGKASTPQELRAMSAEDLGMKARSLIAQYDHSLKDTAPTATKVRTWILRELRAILTVEHRTGVRATYGDDIARALFRYGFKRNGRSDYFNENKALYTLGELLARSADNRPGTLPGRERTRCTIPAHEFAEMLMTLEAQPYGTRFTSAIKHKGLRKAREALLAALAPDAPRSVLFYENGPVRVLMLLLFFVVSIDDPSHEVSVGLAEDSVGDLVTFYTSGTLAELDALYDVLMSFVMRPTAPMQVVPLMAALRPIAVGLMVKFARHVKSRAAIDMILQPLVDAYNTNERETRRQEKARKAAAAAAEEAAAEDDAAAAEGGDEDDVVGTEIDTDSEIDEESDEESDGDEEDAAAEVDEATDADEAEDNADEAAADGGEEDEESWASEGEDSTESEESNADERDADTKASPEYLKSLESMLGVDAAEAAAHFYPRDQENKEKSDVVRCITLASRLAAHLRTPLVVQVFQVLLAVLRENVKVNDDVVYTATKAAIELLHRSRNRYFGYWVRANSPTLLVLLADIQSYCRKLEKSLVDASKTNVEEGQETVKLHAQALSRMRKRLATTKRLALSTFHFIGYLAYKNHADEAVRVTLAEHYRVVYCDRGWDAKRGPEQLRADMFHYRHGFAWCFLDAIVSKYERLKHVDSAVRARAFMGACDAIRAMLPRLAGLPLELKERAAGVIKRFLQGTTLHEIYTQKHTMLYEYFGALKMTVEYNRRVELDLSWAATVVNEVTDDDALQITHATARVVARLESLMNLTERILNIKACVPRALLQKQHPTAWRRNKTRHRAVAERQRTKVETELLAVRNQEPTPQERVDKKFRRAAMRRDDRNERARLRQQRWDKLTAEEKGEARTKSKAKKQERIFINSERKRTLHERRDSAFKKWRTEKLQQAADDADPQDDA